MGLTKQYLRYVASAVFGLIGSQKGNIVFVTLRGEKGRYVAVPACEHVFIWDLRKGEKVSRKPPGSMLACGCLRMERRKGNLFSLVLDSQVSGSSVFYTNLCKPPPKRSVPLRNLCVVILTGNYLWFSIKGCEHNSLCVCFSALPLTYLSGSSTCPHSQL